MDNIPDIKKAKQGNPVSSVVRMCGAFPLPDHDVPSHSWESKILQAYGMKRCVSVGRYKRPKIILHKIKSVYGLPCGAGNGKKYVICQSGDERDTGLTPVSRYTLEEAWQLTPNIILVWRIHVD